MRQAAAKQAEAAKAVPEPEPALTEDLSEALSAAKLSHYEDALRALGCAMASDLRDLDESDLMEIGMKKIEVKRLQRLS